MYSEIKEALRQQIESNLEGTNFENVDVFGVPYQDLAYFPAITIEIKRRRKPIRGIGVRELQFEMEIWVYTNILDSEEAEEQCLELVELVEQAIESDKTLGKTAHYLNINEETNFGTVEYRENNFLQGAQIQIQVNKRIP